MRNLIIMSDMEIQNIMNNSCKETEAIVDGRGTSGMLKDTGETA